jgi:hypothetical protein
MQCDIFHGLACRWKGEPVKSLLLPTKIFSSNKRGYPVLSKAHQELLIMFFKLRVQVMFFKLRVQVKVIKWACHS